MIRKGAFPSEYVDSWEKFNETALLPKNDLYGNLNLENISGEDYVHAKKVCDVFKIKNLGEYHDLYVKIDTLLLVDIYENFRNMCLNIYKLDHVHFVSAPGLAWQVCLKKAGVKLELITHYDRMLTLKKILGVQLAKQHLDVLKQIINI